MPAFIEAKLKREYPGNGHAVYGTLNKIAKGRSAQRKHDKASKPTTMGELMKNRQGD